MHSYEELVRPGSSFLLSALRIHDRVYIVRMIIIVYVWNAMKKAGKKWQGGTAMWRGAANGGYQQYSNTAVQQPVTKILFAERCIAHSYGPDPHSC